MKKSISIIGLCAGLLSIWAFLFWMLQFPGAGYLALAAAVVDILFIILYGCHLSKNENKSKFLVWFNAVIFLLFVVGAAFKLLHFPGGAHMLLFFGFLAIIDFIILLIHVIRK